MKLKVSLSRTLHCPNHSCPSHQLSPESRHIVRFGRFFRADESRWIPRFRCRHCSRTFSSASFSPAFRQKKRSVNTMVFRLLATCVTQKGTARILRVNPKTVARKLVFLAEQARLNRLDYLKEIQESGTKISDIQFDEMETFEKSKCLPLSIPLVVETKTRKILGARVAVMPSKGLLAPISLKKYGPRADERAIAARQLFEELRGAISRAPMIHTDQNPKYPNWLKPHFEAIKHKTTRGRRGCVVGQGELKAGGFDPLFSLNHTAAMIRANVSRMVRRTWCVTQRPDRLLAHLEIYIHYHNQFLTV